MGHLYFDSINRTLDEAAQQTSMIAMYSLVGRIRAGRFAPRSPAILVQHARKSLVPEERS
jgi:hypothetical protein